jgi:hypothetical protein
VTIKKYKEKNYKQAGLIVGIVLSSFFGLVILGIVYVVFFSSKTQGGAAVAPTISIGGFVVSAPASYPKPNFHQAIVYPQPYRNNNHYNNQNHNNNNHNNNNNNDYQPAQQQDSNFEGNFPPPLDDNQFVFQNQNNNNGDGQ